MIEGGGEGGEAMDRSRGREVEGRKQEIEIGGGCDRCYDQVKVWQVYSQ